MMEAIPLENLDRESNPKDESNVVGGSNTESTSNVDHESIPEGGSITEDENTLIGGSNVEDGSMDSINRIPSWWRLISTSERILAAVLICTTIIMFVIVVTCYLRKPQAAEKRIPCMTPGCIRTASRMLSDMDPEVEPCDNFYKFACGNFIRNQEIPYGKTGIDRWSTIEKNLISKVRLVVEEPKKPEDPKPLVIVKNLYKACMNTSLNESREMQPFSKAFESFGGWPVVKGDKWDEEEFDWKKTVVQFKKNGFKFNPFFTVTVGILYTNPRKYTIELKELTDIDFRNLRRYLINGMEDPIVKAYYNYMVDIAVLLGAPKKSAAAEMKESLLFEIKLANISVNTINVLPDHYTIDELEQMYSIVAWPEYINALLPSGVTIDDVEEVIVNEKIHLRYIQQLISSTQNRVIANYLMWKIISDNIELLTADFRKRELEFKTALSGKTEPDTPRLEYCEGLIWDNFEKVFHTFYARKHFNANAKNNVTDMVNRIQAEVPNILENVDWLDENTRKNMLKNAQNMTAYIAYPDDLLEVDILEEYYKDLQIEENKFKQSLLNLKVFSINQNLKRLKEPVRETTWKILKDISKVKAYYQSDDNSINFPIGMFQDVFFSADRPQYMNYGAIGHIISHEIIHGLSDPQSNLDGILRSRGYKRWSKATRKAYEKEAQCLNEQYGNYTVEQVNLKVSGVNTQEENVADNGGIKAAYLAYTRWIAENGEEPQLPGLNYTSRQMFWLSFGSMWCSKYTPEWIKKYIEENKHSPNEFRLLGPLKNNEDFAYDFECPLGCPMNPEHKCKVF